MSHTLTTHTNKPWHEVPPVESTALEIEKAMQLSAGRDWKIPHSVAIVSAKTYKATLLVDGTCVVHGLLARFITGTCNNTRSLDRQNALRHEIQARLYTQAPAAYVLNWQAE